MTSSSDCSRRFGRPDFNLLSSAVVEKPWRRCSAHLIALHGFGHIQNGLKHRPQRCRAAGGLLCLLLCHGTTSWPSHVIQQGWGQTGNGRHPQLSVSQVVADRSWQVRRCLFCVHFASLVCRGHLNCGDDSRKQWDSPLLVAGASDGRFYRP